MYIIGMGAFLMWTLHQRGTVSPCLELTAGLYIAGGILLPLMVLAAAGGLYVWGNQSMMRVLLFPAISMLFMLAAVVMQFMCPLFETAQKVQGGAGDAAVAAEGVAEAAPIM